MPKRKVRKPLKIGSSYPVEYKGKLYTLHVAERNGKQIFTLSGKHFASPTAAAKTLTNYAVNGWKFWHLDQ